MGHKGDPEIRIVYYDHKDDFPLLRSKIKNILMEKAQKEIKRV